MAKYLYKPATELAQLIREGRATSTEIVQEHLVQIEKHNAALNAVIISLREDALHVAAECDREARQGDFRGPLHGVPMTVKEQFWVKDTKSTINTNIFKDWVAPEDAIIVDRLKKAGAVLLGKTNIPKDLLDYQVQGDLYPEGKNPYNTDYSPGGSSGGSAAALASGMVPLELGGDFGGSIRIPSYFCGLFGMKPTENTIPGHGVVPKPKGARGHVFHMANAGPMARTMEDMELGWKIIRGPHHSDRVIPRIKWVEPADKPLSAFRVAWLEEWPGYEPSPGIKTLIRDLVSTLKQNGCQTEQATPGNDLHTRSLSVWMRIFGMVLAQDVPWFIKPLMKRQIGGSILKGHQKFRKEFNAGFSASFLDYSEALGIRAGMISEWEQYFEQYDLLICPMSFGPAFRRCKLGDRITYDGKTMIYGDYCWPYVACFNASGHPAMNFPLGLNAEGLPVGVQIVGPYWSEPTIIHFAKLVSKFTPGFVKPEGY